MHAYIRKAVALVSLVALGPLSPAPISAQDGEQTPVFIAIPQTFPDVDARVVLMREPGRDVVVLDAEDATPESLHIALQILERMKRDHPRPADRGQLVPITGFVYQSPLDPERRSALESVLADLRGRPLANIGNLGLGRWMPYREG